MNIPKSIKIGGKWYKVEKTDKLRLGSENYSAELDSMNQVIRIVPAAKGQQDVAFLHEVVHGMMYHLGYKNHDEILVDGIAQSLYMVITDNPEIFGEMKK